MITCQATRRGEPEHEAPATWIDEFKVLWCDAHAHWVRRLNQGRVRLRRVSPEGAWWPPVAVGAPALHAFPATICPVRSTCRYCGTEILFGGSATRLEVELRLCSACPGTEAERQAYAEGVVIGMRSGAGEEELPGENFMLWPPYERWKNGNPPDGPTPRWNAWRLGWWAGHFAAREDGVDGRFALAVNDGTLRPSG